MQDTHSAGPIAPELAGGLLTVDLRALRHNWQTLRAASGGAECSAVVKADAYGVGQDAAIAALSATGCATFFVAQAHEAFRARAVAPGATVYLLNGLPPGSSRRLAAAGVRPVLGSLQELAEWRREAGEAPCGMHLDTGMNRLGLTAGEAQELARQGGDGLALVMSHFVASEEPDNPLNQEQIAKFAALSALFPGATASLANSSGIMLPAAPHFGLTRPGYALYGGNPTPGRPNPMRPVVRLEARILQVRDVPEGETVGYNARWRAIKPSRVALISLGYADGMPRAASVSNQRAPQTGEAGAERANTDQERAEHGSSDLGGAALVGGQLCRFAGTVSMDLIAIDVTSLGQAGPGRGDMATIIGDALDVDAVAARMGSIGYETLTSLGRRYARRYLEAQD